MMFQKVEGENAILSQKGFYLQCDIYERMGALYAKIGSRFVRLYANGSTSHTGTRLDTLAYNGPLYQDRLGRLATGDGEGHKPLHVTTEGTLQLENKT